MEDQTKRGAVKAVLVFSALVIGVVSLYTTFMVFAAPEHISLSPGDYVPSVNESNGTNSSSGGDSFVIDEEEVEDFVGAEEEGNDFSTDTLPGNDGPGAYTGLINPLVVYEELKVGEPSWYGATGFFFLALLEIFVIYFVYRRVEKGFQRVKG